MAALLHRWHTRSACGTSTPPWSRPVPLPASLIPCVVAPLLGAASSHQHLLHTGICWQGRHLYISGGEELRCLVWRGGRCGDHDVVDSRQRNLHIPQAHNNLRLLAKTSKPDCTGQTRAAHWDTRPDGDAGVSGTSHYEEQLSNAIPSGCSILLPLSSL